MEVGTIFMLIFIGIIVGFTGWLLYLNIKHSSDDGAEEQQDNQ